MMAEWTFKVKGNKRNRSLVPLSRPLTIGPVLRVFLELTTTVRVL
jgi:hypothetical protein